MNIFIKDSIDTLKNIKRLPTIKADRIAICALATGKVV
jgi:hypothetical protein